MRKFFKIFSIAIVLIILAFVLINRLDEKITINSPFNFNNQKMECLPDTAPWIKIVSPNGGEVFSKEKTLNSLGNSFDSMSNSGSIPLKLEFCHINKEGTFILVLVDENNKEDSGASITTDYETFLKDPSIKYSPFIKTGKYKALVKLIDPDNYKVTDSYLSTDLSDDFFLIKIEDSTIDPKESFSKDEYINIALKVVNEELAKELKGKNILEYKINKIDFIINKKNTTLENDNLYFSEKVSTNAFLINFNYSLRCMEENKDYCIAGNGEESNNGWTINKTLYMVIDKNENGYYAVNSGTGL